MPAETEWTNPGAGRLRRIAPLAGLTTRTLGEAAVVTLRSKLTGESNAEFHRRTAVRYAETLGRSKGALMKFGQMLSFAAVSAAVSPEFQSIYQTALARLCSDTPAMDPEVARVVLERELGSRFETAFAEFDWQPIAAASIGQVHSARLRDGRAVAVKIQYPGVAEAIGSDLKNAELLVSFLTFAFGGLSPRGLSLDIRRIARECSGSIEGELDYRLEARNQSEFAEHYREHPFIHIPEVIHELSTNTVLTQDLVHGLSWDEALLADQDLRDRWAEAIHRFVYRSYIRLNVIHADPHPGNLLFHRDGSVSFLDFGCVKRLRREMVEMLLGIYSECFRGDVQGAWRASVEAGMWRSTDPVTPEEVFAYLWEYSWMEWNEERFVVTPKHVSRGIERRFSPMGPSGNALRYCTMPPEYALIARAEIAASSLIGRLGAGGNWHSLVAEYCWDAPPLTPMGVHEREFLELSAVPDGG
jgi:predicted unusual protein kinase regulating ubiquinone biosynthesis (AarF/ABC1/UbiB family)